MLHRDRSLLAAIIVAHCHTRGRSINFTRNAREETPSFLKLGAAYYIVADTSPLDV